MKCIVFMQLYRSLKSFYKFVMYSCWFIQILNISVLFYRLCIDGVGLKSRIYKRGSFIKDRTVRKSRVLSNEAHYHIYYISIYLNNLNDVRTINLNYLHVTAINEASRKYWTQNRCKRLILYDVEIIQEVWKTVANLCWRRMFWLLMWIVFMLHNVPWLFF